MFQKPEQNNGNDSGTSKSGLQDLSADLNARMTLIAMEQAQTKEDNTVGNTEQNSQSKLQYFIHSFRIYSQKIFSKAKVLVENFYEQNIKDQ